MKPKPCKTCGSPFHAAWYHKPRKQLTVKNRMNKIGKVQKQTAAAVNKWKRTQKPTHEGYYECYMCGKWIGYLMTEHVKSKVRHPELRTAPRNFKPTCAPCNEKKGSKDLQELEGNFGTNTNAR